MNERIQKLLTPKLKEWGGGSGDNFSEELEAFAELIVRECVRIGLETEYYSEKNWFTGIEEHFGVE